MEASEKKFIKAAHDLRSPISVLKAYLEYRKSTQGFAEDERRFLESLEVVATKLNRIADELGREGGEISANDTESNCIMNKDKSSRSTDCAKKILVVDDDAGVRLQWRMYWEKRGFETIEVANGESLLAMKLDFSAIGTALVDYHYEGSELNGLDVIEYLSRKKINAIYLCTANHSDKQLIANAFALAVQAVIPKPLRAENLHRLFS